MKSNQLLSRGLVVSGLRRYWPLWLALFVVLVLSLDAPIYSAAIEISGRLSNLGDRIESMHRLWYSARIGSLTYALVASLIVAVAIDEYLFDSRAATFVGSLPIRRQTIFASEFALGYAALLGVFGLTVILLLPLRLALGPIFSIGDVALWFVVTAAVTFVLYSFAQLSCHLSGSRAIAVLLYGVMNFLAVCLEQAVRLAIAALQYGMSGYDFFFDKMSPVIWLSKTILSGASTDSSSELMALAFYVLISVCVVVGTAALFIRRNLESAGESIAIPALRPLLRYLSGISMALLFSSVYCVLRLSNVADGVPVSARGAVAIAYVMVVGSLLGVLFSEMIMRRSAHVPRRCWRDGLVLACASLAFVAICWFDLLGVARRVPDPEGVERVTIAWDYSGEATLTSQDLIAEVCQLHRGLLDYDSWQDSDAGSIVLTLRYVLKNGHMMIRQYPVMANYGPYVNGEEPANEGALLVEEFTRIADSTEGRLSRFADVLDLEAPSHIEIEYYVGGETGEYRTIEISPGDRADFIEHALRPDILEEPMGEIGRTFVMEDNPLEATLMIFKGQEKTEDEICLLSEYLSENAAPHTLSWLSKNHLDLMLTH